MDEDVLCKKLEDVYADVRSIEAAKGKAFDLYVERLSYLVVAAGRRSSGSKRLDAILSRVQKETPTLVVPRHVMTPAELEKLLDAMATEGEGDPAYSAYQKRSRTISELIAEAKKAITARSGFKFDPSVRVIRSQ